MAVQDQVEKKFRRFIDFCKSNLGTDEVKIIQLINIRYKECSPHFKYSTEMLKIIKSTKTNMTSEPKRNMIHLKDFLQELKAYTKKRKSKESGLDRVAKLRKMDDMACTSEASSTESVMSDMEISLDVNNYRPDQKLNSMIKNNSTSSSDIITCDEKSSNQNTCINLSENDNTNDSIPQTIKNESSVKSVTSLYNLSSNVHLLSSTSIIETEKTDEDLIIREDEKIEISGDANDSCVILDVSSPTEKSQQKKKSFLSFLNLKPTPSKDRKLGSTDKDIIICDTEDQYQIDKDLKLPGQPLMDRPCASTSKPQSKVKDEAEVKKKAPSEKHIKRLESLLERLRIKIEELRDQELTLDDLDDETSSYIYEDKLERKYVVVWNKLCEIKGRNRTTGRPAERAFSYAGSRYHEINKKIEKMINKHKEFPDFHDVKNVIEKVNRRSNLGLSNSQVDMIAREEFVNVGDILQERRRKDFMCTFLCRVNDNFSFERDPALFDVELQRKLEANQQHGRNNLEEVINKYVDKQFEMLGDGNDIEVVGGKSEDDSSQEEDDEEEEEENIEDVDQFVDDTEILAAYIPSRPAIGKNPKLAAFHAQSSDLLSTHKLTNDNLDVDMDISAVAIPLFTIDPALNKANDKNNSKVETTDVSNDLDKDITSEKLEDKSDEDICIITDVASDPFLEQNNKSDGLSIQVEHFDSDLENEFAFSKRVYSEKVNITSNELNKNLKTDLSKFEISCPTPVKSGTKVKSDCVKIPDAETDSDRVVSVKNVETDKITAKLKNGDKTEEEETTAIISSVSNVSVCAVNSDSIFDSVNGIKSQGTESWKDIVHKSSEQKDRQDKSEIAMVMENKVNLSKDTEAGTKINKITADMLNFSVDRAGETKITDVTTDMINSSKKNISNNFVSRVAEKDIVEDFGDLSDDSQQNNVEFVDSLEPFEKSKQNIKTVGLKLSKFLNSSKKSSLSDFRNRAKDLVTKAMKNRDVSLKYVLPDSLVGITKTEDNMVSSQVSTSSEDFSQEIMFKTNKIAKHLPTHLIKRKSRVDSYIIEIDEADRLDSTTNSQTDYSDDEPVLCERTTCETGHDEVTSSICEPEPDVIILSDSD
ncbi:uncharacterized protein LOC126831130 [Patella vulgata]|uniref:uncharacterized protein LOC126831130 n=1 Tax=Patella vulgata TaxID=6465 RepID=UPI00217F5EB1|nr:uncharacterized protein LOC126831130 [Patella vulgata]